MNRFLKQLIVTSTALLLFAVVMSLIAIYASDITNIVCGPVVEDVKHYNATNISKLIIEISEGKLIVAVGEPSIVIHRRSGCVLDTKIVTEGSTLHVSIRPDRTALTTFICHGFEVELRVPKKVLEEFLLKISAGTAKVVNLSFVKARISIDMGTAKIVANVSKHLEAYVNMGTLLLDIEPSNDTKISVVNNMGTAKLLMKTSGASIEMLSNNMGTVKNTCPLAPTPRISIRNNMGTVKISCSS